MGVLSPEFLIWQSSTVILKDQYLSFHVIYLFLFWFLYHRKCHILWYWCFCIFSLSIDFLFLRGKYFSLKKILRIYLNIQISLGILSGCLMVFQLFSRRIIVILCLLVIKFIFLLCFILYSMYRSEPLWDVSSVFRNLASLWIPKWTRQRYCARNPLLP